MTQRLYFEAPKAAAEDQGTLMPSAKCRPGRFEWEIVDDH